VRGTTITPTEKACNGDEPQIAKPKDCMKPKEQKFESQFRREKQKIHAELDRIDVARTSLRSKMVDVARQEVGRGRDGCLNAIPQFAGIFVRRNTTSREKKRCAFPTPNASVNAPRAEKRLSPKPSTVALNA
jgi:hypothetical protein